MVDAAEHRRTREQRRWNRCALTVNRPYRHRWWFFFGGDGTEGSRLVCGVRQMDVAKQLGPVVLIARESLEEAREAAGGS